MSFSSFFCVNFSLQKSHQIFKRFFDSFFGVIFEVNFMGFLITTFYCKIPHTLARVTSVIYNSFCMKKKLLTLLPLLLVPFTINACNSNKTSLTYGTYIESDPSSLKELSCTELKNKATEDKEVFLLAVYQDKYSDDCLCWNTFKNVIANYTNTYHEVVYTFNAYNQDESIKQLKIEKREDSTPLLYVFNGEKLVVKFSYADSQDKAIFEDVKGEAMNTRVHRKVNKPTMYYINEEYLESNYSKAESLCLLFFRSACSDCKYVIPNVIIPYINHHQLKSNLLLCDIQKQYEEARKEGASEEEKAHYQGLKDKYGLSEKGNSIYGYQNGVVPTIQYIKNGKLEDASVYFNDTVDKIEDVSFYISNSYYSEERLPNLKYLKNMSRDKAVLKGKEIKNGIISNQKGGYYWSQEEASKAHRPLLEAFFDYYLL